MGTLAFVFGRTGVGKTERILSSLDKSIHSYLLVPDRESVIYERHVADMHLFNTDVLTFSRLCDYVARRLGGLNESYITDGAKKVIMWNVVRSLSPSLKQFGSVSPGDMMFCDKMIEVRKELRRNLITPKALSEFAASLDENEISKNKLSDTALICSAYDISVKEKYTDPDGMLGATYERLKNSEFFKDEEVYIDAFTSFTREQYALIGEIIRKAKRVTVSLPYDPVQDGKSEIFRSINRTAARLRKCAEISGAVIEPPVILTECVRKESECMKTVRERVFSPSDKKEKSVLGNSGFRIICANDSYRESEAVCSDICTCVREQGLRYRDIAVVMRNPQEYDGILDAMLRRYGIPFFVSKRTDIKTRPLIKFVTSALDISMRGFDIKLLIPFLKTELSDITADECLLLENYMRKWNISSRRFSDGYEWTMNPRGYVQDMTESDSEILNKLSDIRKRILESFDVFSRAIKGKGKCVRDIALGVHNFTLENGVPEKIRKNADKLIGYGDRSGSEEMMSLYKVFCDALDGLVVCCGEKECSPSEFSLMLGMMLSHTDIGRIPTSVDEVLVSGVAEAKLHGIKTLYMMGTEFGVFPSPISEKGFFSEHDRELLSGAGMELGDDPETRFSEEQYLFYGTASAPSDRLCISYREYSERNEKNTLSPQASRVASLFSDCRIIPADEIIESQFPSSVRPAIEYALKTNSKTGEAVREVLAEDGKYGDIIRNAFYPLDESECELSEENAREIFSKRISTSYSRLENYIKCRFSYFCRYELNLDEGKRAVFGALDIGNIIHFILERSSEFIVKDSKADEKTVYDFVYKEVNGYLLNLFGSSELSARTERTAKYLAKSAVKFINEMREQFSVSKFSPSDFELAVGDGESIPPLLLSDDDGAKVTLRGKIDRVDTYESEDGRLYVRIIDYKTGDKKLNMKNVEVGLDLQMLLYLFSLCDNGEKHYGKKVYPAGVMYVVVKTPSPEKQPEHSSEEKSEKYTSVSGLFLDEPEVMRAMDPMLDGGIIPVKITKKGTLTGQVRSCEAFDELRTEITKTVLDAFGQLKSGIAHAKPEKRADTCDYCKMYPVCRAGKKK